MPKNSQMPSQNSGVRINYLSLNGCLAFRPTLKEFIFGHQNSNITIGGFKQNYVYDLISHGKIEPTIIAPAYEPYSTLSSHSKFTIRFGVSVASLKCKPPLG